MSKLSSATGRPKDKEQKPLPQPPPTWHSPGELYNNTTLTGPSYDFPPGSVGTKAAQASSKSPIPTKDAEGQPAASLQGCMYARIRGRPRSTLATLVPFSPVAPRKFFILLVHAAKCPTLRGLSCCQLGQGGQRPATSPPKNGTSSRTACSPGQVQ